MVDDSGPPETGTALDEFLPLYWHLSHRTKHRDAYTAAEVDLLDLSVVAMLLGIGPDNPDDPHGYMTGDFAADSRALIQRRVAEAEAKRVALEAAAT